MDQCPSRSELEDFLNDRLPAEREARVLAHLDGCSVCQRVLERVTAGLVGDEALSRFNAVRSTWAVGAGGDGLVNPAPTQTAAWSRRLQAQTTLVSSAGSTSCSRGANLADHPDYAIVRELGAGGMGVVYLARNRLLARDEVLKVIGPDVVSDPGILDRFLREMRSVARLRHPNVVSAYTAFRWGGSLVFAMEYVDGLDLRRMVESTGPIPVGHACAFVQQAATALQHAFEEGMVHRDIKPSNLMLTHRKNRALIKVLDFGLARATSEQDADAIGFDVATVGSENGQGLTRTGQMLGTPAFIAPEQIADSRSADTRADIYSLGCTLYYLLSGRVPFHGETLYETLLAQQRTDAQPLDRVRPDVPAELATVVTRMMEKMPDRRFQEPAEVAEALSPFFKKRPSSVGTWSLGSPGLAEDGPDLVAAEADRLVSKGSNPSAKSRTAAIRPESLEPSPARSATAGEPPALPIPLLEVRPERSKMIAFSCAGCGKAFSASESLAGREVPCRDCGTVTTVAAAVFVPALKRKKNTRTDPYFYRSLGVGCGLAVVALNVPLTRVVLGCLATVIHELGHTATSWLFGFPAVPAFDLVYGGGITRGIGRQPALLVGVYAIFASLLFLASGHLPKLVMGVVAIGLYSVAAFTPLHNALIAAMGHGTELLVAGIFLYRALSGNQVLRGVERPLYACLGLCLLFGCSRSAFELMTSEAHREAYHVAHGGLVMDLDAIADEYLHWPLERVAALYLFACILTPVVAIIAHLLGNRRDPQAGRVRARPASR